MKYLDNAIKNYLQPVLDDARFTKIKAKHFQRKREKFIDEIWFQVSQYGSGLFYVHYSCQVIFSSRDNVFLEVGNRYDASSRKYRWIANNESSAKISILDVINLVKIDIIPWFDNIITIRDFLVEDCMMNYRIHGGTIIEYFKDEKLQIAKIDKKCFYIEALKFESIKEDTIEKYTAQMIEIATSSLSDRDMSLELERIDKKIKLIFEENRIILMGILKKCYICPVLVSKQTPSIKNE